MNAQDPASLPHLGVDAAEAAAALITAVGFPRMPGRVMMALIAAPAEGYTAAELADRLGVSPAAVSGAVRYLQTLHVVHRVSRADQRRDHYLIVEDTWYGMMTNNSPVYERLAAHIDTIGAEHTEDPVAHNRATEMAEFFRYMAHRMPELIDEWESYRAERRLAE
ncbi:MAG: MarR family transcriptional regulator [Actinobacteria bacterium]|nr:MarR family transcriptional regulator [Actinomycetota bacterium]